MCISHSISPLQLAMLPVMQRESSYIGGKPLREAYQINKLVDEDKVTPEQASEASRQEIDQMIATIFSLEFSQNYFRPWEIKEKTMGQKAEDILVELLNRFPWFHLRHATEQEDHIKKLIWPYELRAMITRCRYS